MEFKTVLVNLDIDEPVAPMVNAAVDLARRFNAALVAVCAARVPLSVTASGGGILVVEAWQQMRRDLEICIAEIRAEFNRLTAEKVLTQWRDSLEDPSHAVVGAAKLADLVVLGARWGASTGDAYRTADPKDVVLQAGRPMLVLANGADGVKTSRICIAWKDSREARRATVDALPSLALADEVTVVNVGVDDVEWARKGVADVVGFLDRHGIQAKSELIASADEGPSLLAYAEERDINLVVSGAYGRSRLQEWVFGGMTRSLLDATKLHRFMSS
jgi:nucleotide-binding universal stress UspA family protein